MSKARDNVKLLNALGSPYVVYVEEYGAIGDDATDCTAAFAAAYADVQANGRGIIKAKGGRYRFSGPLNWNMNNFAFDGGASGATILRPTHTTGNVIQLGNSSSIRRTMRLNGFSVRPVNTRTAGANIAVEGAADVRLEDVEFGGLDGSVQHGGYRGIVVETYGNQSGLHLAEVRGFNLTNDFIVLGENSSTVVNEIFIQGGLVATSCRYALVLRCASGIYGGGISIYQCTRGVQFQPRADGVFGVWLSNALADSCTEDGWVFESAASGAEATNINLSNVSGATCRKGWAFYSGCNVNAVTISNITADNCTQEGVYIQSGKKISIVGGNVFHNSSSGSAAYNGLLVLGAPTHITLSNLFSGQGGIFEENSIANFQQYGIAIDNAADNYSVLGCMTPGNVTGGIFGTSGTSTKVMANNRNA